MTLEFDPEIAAALAGRPPGPPEFPVGEWEQRRRVFDAMTIAKNARLDLPADVDIRHERVIASDGSLIPVRIYRRRSNRTGGTVVYLHGGGHFCCDIEASDPNCRRYASESGVTVVSVDYRFAPEHPFPTAVEDAYSGLVWAAENLGAWDGSAQRLAIMGDSAGGGMAAGVALMARDRRGPPIAAQLLIYPMLDDRTVFPDGAIAPLLTWSYADNQTGWSALLGDLAGTDAVSSYAAPSRAKDLSGLPPAYIEVGQLDAFRDEDVAYALALSRAGVPVELHMHPGAPHDFDGLAPDAAVTRRVFADRARVLRLL